MEEVKRIQDQLRRAHQGQAWHGPSVNEVLAGVTHEKALARPIAGAHTIWEIVLHINAWQKAVANRLDGKTMKLSTEEDWPALTGSSESAWKQILQELDHGYQQVQAAIDKLSDSQLEETAEGEEYSNYYMLHGLVQHNLFHAGQISLLKKRS